MQGIPVKELFVTYQADVAPQRLVRVVLGVRPSLVEAVAAVGLRAKAAVLELLGGSHGLATRVARQLASKLHQLLVNNLPLCLTRHLLSLV